MDACPQCTHPHVVKAGKARGNQRWLCRGCGYQFTRTTPRGRPLWQKSLAVFLYGHGISMNALAKMVGVHASSVLQWIRRFALEHSAQPAPVGKAIVLAVEEMWHFRKTNGTNAGSGRRWIVIQATSLTGRVGVVLRQP
jgi:transposase